MATDPLALESGLPEGIATTENARFERDVNVGDGEILLLKIDFRFHEGGDTQTQFYRIGNGWETHDKGRTVEHEAGPNKNYQKNAKVGSLITAMMEAGAEADMRERLAGDLTLQTAAFFDGWTFDWYRRETPLRIKDRDTGEMIDIVVTDFIPRPDSYPVGEGEVEAAPAKKAASKAAPAKAAAKSAPAKSAAKAPAKKAAAKPQPVAADDSAGGADEDEAEPEGAVDIAAATDDDAPYKVSDEVWQKLYDIAYNADDVDSFQELAYVELADEAASDPNVAAAIDDVDSESPHSIWAEAVANWQAENG